MISRLQAPWIPNRPDRPVSFGFSLLNATPPTPINAGHDVFQVNRMEYPRPQLVRSQYQKLNGAWKFWYEDAPSMRQIQVPFPYQSKLSGIEDKAYHPVVWYQRAFQVPAEWGDQWQDRDLLMHFGAVDYQSRIFINDKEVGQNSGGHVPFDEPTEKPA